MSSVKIQGNPSGTGIFTIASPGTSTDRTLTLPDATGTVVTKSSTYIAPADLGSGTPSSSNFLRGDNSWQVISTTPTTADVLSATAGASANAVGTYAWMWDNSLSNIGVGATIAGSNLRFAGITANGNHRVSGTAGSGTWRCMGFGDFATYGVNGATMFLRIS